MNVNDISMEFPIFPPDDCKQHIILNHVFFQYESNLEPVTLNPLN